MERNQRKKVCLSMIVKNESHVIKRCLGSLKQYIDYWVIVDTGSTDGTQDIIKEFMKDVPGELHQSTWVNFAHNRNESLEIAKKKGDYTLIIDADEVFAFDEAFAWPPLDKDFYYIMTNNGGMDYVRVQLINNKLDWKWVGVVHEVVISTQASTFETLQGVRNIVSHDGARSKDPNKYLKDAEILETALKQDPENRRYQFYLAQSYRDAGNDLLALHHYKKRFQMGGWDQELFWSLLQIAMLEERLGMAPEVVISNYNTAYWYRPARIEPLYHLSNWYRKRGNYLTSYLIAKEACKKPIPEDVLFIERWIYDYGMLLEYSVSAYWIGQYEEARYLSLQLLAKPGLPKDIRDTVEKNLGFIHEKLGLAVSNIIPATV